MLTKGLNIQYTKLATAKTDVEIMHILNIDFKYILNRGRKNYQTVRNKPIMRKIVTRPCTKSIIPHSK